MKKTSPALRVDLLFLLLLPLPAGAAALALTCPLLPAGEQILQTAALFALAPGLLLEIAALQEAPPSKTSDSGLISVLVTSLVILFAIAGRTFAWPGLFSGVLRPAAFTVGFVLYPSGLIMRFLARKELGRHFSYSLRLQPEHRLVTSGIYSRIRHPAYLGTVCSLTGLALLYGTGLALLAAAACIPLFLGRIHSEEKMLADAFPEDFPAWKNRTGTLLPKRNRR